MEIDPMDAVEKAEKQSGNRTKHLNMVIAITVALLASFLGVCKVKDDNIVQSMQQMQANKLDHWAYYQARNIREDVAKATLVQLRLAAGSSAAEQIRYQSTIEAYEKMAAEQRQKKEELKAQAEQDQRDYDAANFRDDQFDMSDALIAIAISMLAVTALTHQWWFYFLSLIPSALGVVMGLAGFAGWPIHPEALIRLLS
jgi:hypothetical protein